MCYNIKINNFSLSNDLSVRGGRAWGAVGNSGWRCSQPRRRFLYPLAKLILLSLIHSNHFSLAKNALGYQRIEQWGSIYL